MCHPCNYIINGLLKLKWITVIKSVTHLATFSVLWNIPGSINCNNILCTYLFRSTLPRFFVSSHLLVIFLYFVVVFAGMTRCPLLLLFPDLGFFGGSKFDAFFRDILNNQGFFSHWWWYINA